MLHDENEPTHRGDMPAGQPAGVPPPGVVVGPGYEVRDTNVRSVLTFIVSLFLFLLVCQVVLWGLLRAIRGSEGAERFTPDSAPEVITEQLRQLRQHETAVLKGEAPVGKEAGKTRISVDRAIELLAERGIPPTPGPARTEEEVMGDRGSKPDREGKSSDKSEGEKK